MHIGIARSFQITNVLLELHGRRERPGRAPAAPRPQLRVPARRRARSGARSRARALLEEVGLAARAEAVAGELAHGEKRQLELAMTLASQPRLVLLDEPMAGIGHDEAARMVELLLRIKRDRAMLLVEHDMDAVFRIADRITVLVGGRAIASGAPAAIRDDPAVREAYLGEGEPDGAAARGRGSPRRLRLRQRAGGVSLAIDAGEVVSLLGRNGMGKTTTVRAIMGLLRPSRGTVRFRGVRSRAGHATRSRAPGSVSCRRAVRCSPISASRRT